MKILKTIIIDDEPRGINTLRALLGKHCPQVDIVDSYTDAAIAKDGIQKHRPDIVFLDIVMPRQSGLDFLASLDSIDFEIIFVTAYDDYMLQAFRYSAIDYILKPADEELLVQAVERAALRIEEKVPNTPINTLVENLRVGIEKLHKLCVSSVKGFVVINLDDIIYMEAKGNYSCITIKDHPSITTSKSIMDYTALLDHTHFVRIHKSYLINLQHMVEYQKGEGGMVLMNNGQWLEVSRRRKEDFLIRVKKWLNA
jgi:two-component system, LytTR family, response regulator